MTLTRRPLLVTGHEAILDELVRIAAACGLEFDVGEPATVAGSRWVSAPLVVVGDDAVSAAAHFPRRPGVVVVCREGRSDSAEVWRGAVALGAEHVAVVPEAERWLVERLTSLVEGPSSRGMVMTVVPGRGGAGASTLAVLLARSFRGSSLIVETDPLGGALGPWLGMDAIPGLRWPDLVSVRGRLSPSALRGALPHVDGIAVVASSRTHSGAVPCESLEAVIDAGSRAFELTLLDGTRDASALSHLAWANSDLVIVCTTGDVCGFAATKVLIETVAATGARTAAVLRTTRETTLSCIEAEQVLEVPVIGEWKHDRAFAQAESPLTVPLRRSRGLAQAAFDMAASAAYGRAA